ncbi:MAG: hypothetical protein IPJ85_11500 [Flavobacteriales bacterium]|nr:hypothetical protein [Flavobacteriales bacterium]
MSGGTAAWNGLLLVLVLLGPIRWALDLDRYELWHDETYSLAAAAGLGLEQQDFTGPFKHADLLEKSTFRNAVSACLRNDGGNGILHVILLRQWIQIAPRTVFGIRLSSFIAACITLLVIGLFVIDIFGDMRAALLTTALIAHNPLMTAAAVEVRSYPLAILFQLGSCLVDASVDARQTIPVGYAHSSPCSHHARCSRIIRLFISSRA